jgi:hypothetical protein
MVKMFFKRRLLLQTHLFYQIQVFGTSEWPYALLFLQWMGREAADGHDMGLI